MKTDITQIVVTLIDVMPWAAIATIIIKWWQHSKYARYIPYVKTAVQYAEQVLVKSTGNDKRIWVENYISQKLKGKIKPDDLDKLIESSVLEMNSLLNIPAESKDNNNTPSESKEVQQPLISQELLEEIAKETASNLVKKLSAINNT